MKVTSHSSCGGFTLLELLAVISMILLLAALLVPSLGAFRERAQRTVCLSNMRQLQAAFVFCTVDRDGQLPSSDTSASYGTTSNDWWAGTSDFTIGIVWPYIMNEEVYACPSYPPVGLQKNLKRHYSLSTRLGSRSGGPGEAIYSMSRVRSPAKTHVFIEEYDNRLNFSTPRPGPLNGFSQSSSGYKAIDCPPTWHNMGANFSFLDGHVEYRKWSGPLMQTIDCNTWFWSQYGLNFDATKADRNDWEFFLGGITNAY